MPDSRVPDLLFTTPKFVHENILRDSKYENYISSIGLMVFPELDYFSGVEYVHSSYTIRRLIYIANRKNNTADKLNYLISTSPYSKKSLDKFIQKFFGFQINFKSIIISSFPDSSKRMISLTVNDTKKLEFKNLPISLSKKAFKYKIYPILLLGYSDLITNKELNSHIIPELIRENLKPDEKIISEYEINLLNNPILNREKVNDLINTKENMYETSLVILGGDPINWMSYFPMLKNIGFLSRFNDVLVISICYSDDYKPYFYFLCSLLMREQKLEGSDRKFKSNLEVPTFNDKLFEILFIFSILNHSSLISSR
jgi:hypothetical protein